MYAAERVGKNGRVVGVDLQDIAQPSGSNLLFVRGDVFELGLRHDASVAGVANPVLDNAPYAVVLSDMAPSTSGSKASDQARSFDLFMRALEIALRLGAKGSSFVGKIFMSGDFPAAKKAVAERYATCRVLKPEGTRKSSTEIYIVGSGLEAAPEA
jgi:23S rRNA (uridine2552-2'-O)-methyltransferase